MSMANFMAALGLAGLVTGCTTNFPRLTEPNQAYREALKRTAGEQPDDPARALQGVIDLFADFSRTNLEARLHGVYADSLFFRDGFKELYSMEELEPYMLESTEPLRSCTFEFSEPVMNPPDYYLHWTMRVSMKRDKPGHLEEVIGMSHLRFNAEGRVVFQQDYWDPTDVLYRRIPIARGLIGYVRSKL